MEGEAGVEGEIEGFLLQIEDERLVVILSDVKA